MYTEISCFLSQVQIGGSPVYRVGQKLGKGGFGQVYLGRTVDPSSSEDQAGFQATEVGFEGLNCLLFCPLEFSSVFGVLFILLYWCNTL